MEPGDLVIISPNEMHRSVCLDDQMYERTFINVKKSVMDRLSTKRTNLFECFESHPIGQKNLTHLNAEQMRHFIDLADKLAVSLASDGYGQDILVDSYLSQLLVYVNTMYRNSGYPGHNIMPELIRDIMSYVEDHLSETITMEQLSRRFFLSSAYISRQFKKHIGLSLRQYILDRRIAVAKILLIEGKNVSEACYMSGFSDYANFIRSFTKHAGVTPGQMKRKLYR
jgi:AraC-like DNA-binding protein